MQIFIADSASRYAEKDGWYCLVRDTRTEGVVARVYAKEKFDARARAILAAKGMNEIFIGIPVSHFAVAK